MPTDRGTVVHKLTNAYIKSRGQPFEPKDDTHLVFRSEHHKVEIEVLDDRVRLRGLSSRTGLVEKEIAFDDPKFERDTAEFVGRYLRCYFSTYWMGS